VIRLALLPLVFGVILWIAAALVHDHHRRRRETLLERLGPAFLHSAPLAPQVRLVALQEVDCGGLNLSLPAGWRVEATESSLTCATDHAGDVRLTIEAIPAPAEEKERSQNSRDHASETLASGARLTKSLRVEAAAAGDRLVYEWRLAPSSREAQGRTFRLRLTAPARAATGIFLQSDLDTIDRAAREGRWVSGASSSPSARV
jgi:hypothetical protein